MHGKRERCSLHDLHTMPCGGGYSTVWYDHLSYLHAAYRCIRYGTVLGGFCRYYVPYWWISSQDAWGCFNKDTIRYFDMAGLTQLSHT